METCPCCGYPLVECFRRHQMVSFCRHCWQEMPGSSKPHLHTLFNRRSLEQVLHQAAAQPRALVP
ncbi:MAG: hypothetical protein WCA35_00960 [Kovacikia sp.]